MKIVINSLSFLPNVGGLENVVAGLADAWTKTGHQVIVHTSTDGSIDGYPYVVVRNASLSELRKAAKDADVFFEANISLKTFWIGMLNRRKWFVTHQIVYDTKKNIKEKLKYFLTSYSNNIAASHYIAKRIRGSSTVIPNFYNLKLGSQEDIKKDIELLFVGRLVSDKGAEDLVYALGIVAKERKVGRCTIIGEGPERNKLESLVAKLKLANTIRFTGVLKGEDLVKEISRHKIMVVPSRWDEPFGIVALEGLACGCRIICSSGGGLPEAAGASALLYPNGSIPDLAKQIKIALDADALSDIELKQVAVQLSEHSLANVSQAYINLFNVAANK